MDLIAVAIPGLQPNSYRPHTLHCAPAAWPETNCYVDFWIELLHTLHFDPVAILSFTFLADFEGDQWLLLKPPLEDLFRLYGIDVQEITIWDSLSKQVFTQVSRGRLPIVEVDAFYLPDTQGLTYQIEHTKTTICINEIDMLSERLGYFHNCGYYSLAKEDYRNILYVNTPGCGFYLPPYAEFAKLDGRSAKFTDTLVETSLSIARRNLMRIPERNPFQAFRHSFPRDLDALLSGGSIDLFHKYTFANLRQLGAGFQMAAEYVRWLEQYTPEVAMAAMAFESISETAKTLQFKMARAVNNGKSIQYEAAMDSMELSWQQGFEHLTAKLG